MKVITLKLLAVLTSLSGASAFAQATQHEQFQKALSDRKLNEVKNN